jgi:adenylate cyclase
MLRFRVKNKNEYQEFQHLGGSIEFGRAGQQDDIPRCVLTDRYVSAHHLSILELEGGRVRVQNLSKTNAVHIRDHPSLAIQQSCELSLPVYLTVGETQVEIESVRPSISGEHLETVAQPRHPVEGAVSTATSLLELGLSPSPETLTHWFETVIRIQRAAAGSPEFYEQAARAVVDLVGLDRGLVILRRLGRWMVQSRYPDSDQLGREFSLTILDRVARERRTFFQSSASLTTTESLQGVEAVAASPIFDGRGEVVGVLYGCRNRHTTHAGVGIGALEAQVLQLLASVVEVGLARQQHEAEASRLRVQFEQFFTADLARELEKNPKLLDGQEREVTVLFGDIRGFSRMAEHLGPTDTCRLVSDVMERLTTQVHAFDGVIVDYTGDGLMAMWNAPHTDEQHAVKACHAALGMLRQLPELDKQWSNAIGQPLRLGIGVNSGPALCGNTGSKHKFKYGPLGHAVNVASRVEGATKFLGIPVLITGSTRGKVNEAFATRRLCRARVYGINDPIHLYEVFDEKADPDWYERRDIYERALALYEAGDWAGASRTLAPLLLDHDEREVPTLTLFARAVEAIQSPPERFDGVIEIPFK